jgi:hypothetical protein
MKARSVVALLVSLHPALMNAQAFFVHRATPQNIQRHWTVLDHPSTNGRPGAVVVVTSTWNPNGQGGTYDNHAIGVWYTAGHWAIFNQDLAPMPANAAFNVAVGSSGEPARAAAHFVLPGALVEHRRPDGSILRPSAGVTTLIDPSGHSSMTIRMGVPPGTPPAVPSTLSGMQWFGRLNGELLAVIGALSSDGQTSVDNYLASETTALTVVQQVDARTTAISLLLEGR